MWDENQQDDDLFSAIDGASVKGQRNPYLVPKVDAVDGEPGLYVIEIEAIKVVKARSKRSYYCAEFTIIESNVDSRPPGMVCSWMTEPQADMGPINIKRFLGALVGLVDEDLIDREIDSAISRSSVGPDQPFLGTRAFVQVRKIITKVEKKPFSEHRFEPMDGYHLEDILAARAATPAAGLHPGSAAE